MTSSKISGIPVSGTMEIAAKVIEMQSKGIDVINLCVGEPDLPTPDHIKEAGIKAINFNRTKYTLNVGIEELRIAIKSKFKNEYNADYNSDEIIVSNGAKQALYNAIQTIIDDGEEVIIPLPYYVSYPHMISLAGGIPKFVTTKTENSYKITPKELEENITSKTKAILLCNPNNPTGSVYSRDELLSVVEVAYANNLYIISDEIYEKLTFDSAKFYSISSLGEKFRDKLIIINGVSKAYRMTGWRIGYAAANKDLVKGMNKLQSHSTSAACTISQYAALEALTGDQSSVEDQREILQRRRDLIYNALVKIDGIDFIEPHGAFYFFINIKNFIGKTSLFNNSRDFCLELLEKENVGTVPGSVFGMEGYLRISYATSDEQLSEAMKRLEKFVKNIN